VRPDGPERADERRRSLQFRVAGLGLEFGAGIAGCVLFGYWVDRTFGTANKGVIIGAIVGCVGGMYHLISRAMKLQRAAELDRRKPRSLQDDPGPDADEPGPDS
jgi:F0F1-type ATP synthase assembly protein I